MTVSARMRAQRHQRRQVLRQRDAQVSAMYPHARTFVLVSADAVGPQEHAEEVSADLPRTLTLVTPDSDDPAQDHLYVDHLPVPRRHHRWEPDFAELTFRTADGTRAVHGHLRLTHSRTKAFGVLHYGGHDFSVTFEVKPQRYTMKVAKNAAYLATDTNLLKWDVESDGWRNATWSTRDELGFTYGVDVDEVIGGEKVYSVIGSFDDPVAGTKWVPAVGTYNASVDKHSVLSFLGDPSAAAPGGNLYPYRLRVQLSDFADEFTGAILTGSPDRNGTVYGVRGNWDGGHVAGAYRLAVRGEDIVFGVHDGTLVVDGEPVPGAVVEGNRIAWSDLSSGLAKRSGLGQHGHLVFSADGAQVLGSSLGGTGVRIDPDELLARTRDGRLRGPIDTAHTLSALIEMSQFGTDKDGGYYDVVQTGATNDFYKILQYHMDSDLRRQFFDPSPVPPALGDLAGIAATMGTKGTKPGDWYRELSVAYTAGSLAQWSGDDARTLLNGRRANAWLGHESANSDVMEAHAPLLYQRQYKKKYPNLEWFLLDQRTGAAGYETAITAKAEDWRRKVRAEVAGTPDEIVTIIKQIDDMERAAKQRKLYWAFAVIAYTSTPAYFNKMQTVLASGVEVDGSEYTQRVQRTTALLTALDPSNTFTEFYAYQMQLFELTVLLPQFADHGAEREDFDFGVKTIIDGFIAKYLDGKADPRMQDAADALSKHASQEMISEVLTMLRAAAATIGATYSWTRMTAKFSSTCAQVFANLPTYLPHLILGASLGLLIMFFITGQVKASDVPPQDWLFIGTVGVGVIAQFVLTMVQRGLAVGDVVGANSSFWMRLKSFFDPRLLTDAQVANSTGLRAWLVGNANLTTEIEEHLWNAQMFGYAGMAQEVAEHAGQASRLRTVQVVFGNNLDEFLATRVAAAMAVLAIVMSAIELAKGGVPLQLAANTMFLLAATLDLVAAIGTWVLAYYAGAELTAGLMLISTMLPWVAMAAVAAMVAGAIMLLVWMFKPQPSPVETFARDKAGAFFSPHRAAVDDFNVYQPDSEPQRAGVMIGVDGLKQVLRVDDNGAVRQAAFDATGNTAFYLRCDELGRVTIGAPTVTADGRPALLVLATDDKGNLVTVAGSNDTLGHDPKQLWLADIQGDGSYEKDKGGNPHLRSAPFVVRSAHWDAKQKPRYLTAKDGGWTLTQDPPTPLTLKMVTTAPQQLKMQDVVWYSNQHDAVRRPSLLIPGSLPRTWSVTPDLPNGIELDPATGAVGMVRGATVPASPRKSYQLRATNAAGHAAVSFNLEVR